MLRMTNVVTRERMVRVGVAELSAYLKRAKGGEETVVTERGVPIARLPPIPRTRGPTEAEIQEMLQAGLLQPPARNPDAQWVCEFQAMPRPARTSGTPGRPGVRVTARRLAWRRLVAG